MTPATAVGYVEMRIAKVVGLAADDELFQYVVLDEVAGDRHLAIEIGQPEAFSLAARLGGITWPRPMTYQFVAALVHALGGRVRQMRIDRVVEEAYVATVEVDGPPGVQPGGLGHTPVADEYPRPGDQLSALLVRAATE